MIRPAWRRLAETGAAGRFDDSARRFSERYAGTTSCTLSAHDGGHPQRARCDDHNRDKRGNPLSPPFFPRCADSPGHPVADRPNAISNAVAAINVYDRTIIGFRHRVPCASAAMLVAATAPSSV